jgi:hypothetical protein
MNWFQRILTTPTVSNARNLGRIEFDLESVRFYHPEGVLQDIQWRELHEVSIVRTDEGPFTEEVFFMLLYKDNKGCVIPQSAEGSKELLSRLQMLPNLNNDSLVEAMGSSSN